MRKGAWVAVLGFSLALGLGISLALNGSRGFRFQGGGLATKAQPAFVTAEIPTIAVTAKATALLVADPISVDPPEESPQPVLTLTAVDSGDARPEVRENVLLLYDASHPTSFAVNFCKIAEFYGLLCKRADLNTTTLDEALLRDPQGVYFRVIGLDATTLLKQESLQGEARIRLLKAAVESGSSLLVSKVNLDTNMDATALNTLTDGAILGLFKLRDGHYDWIVSPDAPEVTGVFSGQTITSAATTTQSGTALLLVNTMTATPLISAQDVGGGATLPVFVRWKKGAGAIYVDAGQLAPSLDQVQLRDLYYDPSGFTRIVPLMMTMKAAMGKEAWHTNQHYANLTLDGTDLKEPFQELSYIGLLKEMLEHNFHTTVATIPVKWQESQQAVTSLFQRYPEWFSLAQYGNNNDGYEFYQYQASPEDIDPKYTNRPLADQEWDIQEGLARMELLKSSTGLPYDRVMIFPVGISPSQTLRLLKTQNYLSSVNKQDVPLDTTRPSDWDYGMYPAILDYENFPLLTCRQPGTYRPFKPDIQPFIFDLFLDKPALFFSHADAKELFASGITAFNPVADQINKLPGGVEWQSLGSISKQLYLEKNNQDGSVDIRMYGNDLILMNESTTEKIYHVTKEENLNIPILELSVNGSTFPYLISDGYIYLDLKIPPNSTMEIVIRYSSE